MRRGISEPPEENPAILVRTFGCAAVFFECPCRIALHGALKDLTMVLWKRRNPPDTRLFREYPQAEFLV